MFGPTKDHTLIQAWANRHNARPAQIRPFTFDSEPAILHFIFGDPDRDLEQLRVITWVAFFVQFDLLDLSMVYNDDPTFELLQLDKVSLNRRSPEGLV